MKPLDRTTDYVYLKMLHDTLMLGIKSKPLFKVNDPDLIPLSFTTPAGIRMVAGGTAWVPEFTGMLHWYTDEHRYFQVTTLINEADSMAYAHRGQLIVPSDENAKDYMVYSAEDHLAIAILVARCLGIKAPEIRVFRENLATTMNLILRDGSRILEKKASYGGAMETMLNFSQDDGFMRTMLFAEQHMIDFFDMKLPHYGRGTGNVIFDVIRGSYAKP